MRRRLARVVGGVLALSAAAAPGAANAEPPGVPDVNSLTDVTQDYVQPASRPSSQVVVFATPDGLDCNTSGGSASCRGVLPGLADRPLTQGGDGPCDLGMAGMSLGSGMMSHYRGACPNPTHAKVLNPGQKVSFDRITCGVLDGDLTVCTGGTHGFVLQPSGSFTF